MSAYQRLSDLIRKTHPEHVPYASEWIDSAVEKIILVINDLQTRLAAQDEHPAARLAMVAQRDRIEPPHGSPLRDLKACGCGLCLATLSKFTAAAAVTSGVNHPNFCAHQQIDWATAKCKICGHSMATTLIICKHGSTKSMCQTCHIEEKKTTPRKESFAKIYASKLAPAEPCICFGSRSLRCRAHND